MDILDNLSGSHNFFNIFKCMKYKRDFAKYHPTYFDPSGLLVFCAEQGSGKTLSAVQYCLKINKEYEDCIFCTNVSIKDYPINCYYKIETLGINVTRIKYYTISEDELVRIVTICDKNGEIETDIEKIKDIKIVIPYDGLNCIKDLSNGFEGVLYLIDEIHLEFNSLESKNIPIEIMVEVSQQRKQRKHIVGTSQVYMRLAKPLREQIDTVVLCHNYLCCIQYNKVIDGKTAIEENGKLVADVLRKFLWFHHPKLYQSYDTYAKMKRYRKEWNGVSRSNIYERSVDNGLSSNN